MTHTAGTPEDMSLGELVDLNPETGEDVSTSASASADSASSVPLYLQAATYEGLAELQLSDTQIAALTEPVTDDEIEIKPDRVGALYLSHVGYRRRLNKAFRPGGWGTRQISPWRFDPDTHILSAEFILRARGSDGKVCYVGKAIGGQQYFGGKGESSMTRDDASQAVESNAIMRLGKVLGIALELWERRTANAIRARLGVEVFMRRRDGSTTTAWRRWDEGSLKGETGITPESPNRDKVLGHWRGGLLVAQAALGTAQTSPGTPQSAGNGQPSGPGTPAPQAPRQADAHDGWGHNGIITFKQAKRLYAIVKQSGIHETDVATYLKTRYGIQSSKQIPVADYAKICAWVKQGGDQPGEAHA